MLDDYLDEFVEPTIREFAKDPTSRRRAFLACVVTHHALDRMSGEQKEQARAYLEPIGKVANAFKHVVATRSEPPLAASEVITRPPFIWDKGVWDLSVFNDFEGGVTLDRDRSVDLLDTLRRAVAYLRALPSTTS